MSISAQRLTLATEALHVAAESSHREHGYAQPSLMLIPDVGAPFLLLLPHGLPAEGHLIALIRRVRTTAIALTGEVWVSVPGILPETLSHMPLDDLPRPVEDPQRKEAILTTGVGITPDGPVTVLKLTLIEPDDSGNTVLRPVAHIETSLRSDGTAAYLARLLGCVD